MMMAESLLGPSSLIEGVTVKMTESEERPPPIASHEHMHNGIPNGEYMNYSNTGPGLVEEVIETVTLPHVFASDSAACANCSVSFFDPLGNEIYQRIFFMSLDKSSNEVIQISSVIHILFARKLTGCGKPSMDLALCAKCAELVAQMYQLYRELDELSNVNAYINSFLTSSATSNSIQHGMSYDDSNSNSLPYHHHSVGVQQQQQQNPLDYHHRRDDRIAYTEPPPLTYPEPKVQLQQEPSTTKSNALVQRYVEYLSLTQQQHLQQLHEQEILQQQHTEAQNQQLILQHQLTQTQNLQKQQEGILVQKYSSIYNQEEIDAQESKSKKKKLKKEDGDSYVLSTPLPAEEVKSKKTITCPEPGCSKVYTGKGAKASLRNHTKIVHLKLFPHECPICKKPIPAKSQLDSHLRRHLGKEEREAKGMKSPADELMSYESSPSFVNYVQHGTGQVKQEELSTLQFQQQINEAISSISQHQDQHYQHQHPAVSLYDSGSGTISSYRIPEQSPPVASVPLSSTESYLPQPPSNVCPQCGKILKAPYQLRVHMERHRNASETKFFHCEVPNCGRKFKDKSSLKRHNVNIHEKKENSLNQSSLPQSSSALQSTTPKQQVSQQPQRPNELEFVHSCVKCSEKFKTKKALKEHRGTCETFFYCEAPGCNRKFKQKHHYLSHYAFQHQPSTMQIQQEQPMTKDTQNLNTAIGENRPGTNTSNSQSVQQQPEPMDQSESTTELPPVPQNVIHASVIQPSPIYSSQEESSTITTPPSTNPGSVILENPNLIQLKTTSLSSQNSSTEQETVESPIDLKNY